ncbi:hypothetical protein CM15mP37_02410 [bacterium]|nr:MAG: hypothetical protein CM15mP37_02410 [bacterium]
MPLKIAEFLNDHPGVESVNYPGLNLILTMIELNVSYVGMVQC